MRSSSYFLLFILLLLFSCASEEAPVVKESIRPVRFATIANTSTTSSNTFSGIAQSSKEVKLSFKVSGTLNRLNVKVGDKVQRGQVIAALDAIDYSIEYDRAVANKKNAETQIKSAETQRIATKSAYDRVEKLYENNSVPLSEYEQSKASYEAAVSQYNAALAQVTAAEKQVDAARNQVSYARLKAPFSGIITAVQVEENELVPSGNPVAVLSAETKPEVKVGIPETFISNIRKGQKVDIHFSIISDQNYKGTISEVAFSSSDASTYPVIVQIDQPSADMRPGMAATVTFSNQNQTSKKQRESLIAPVKAVGEGTDGYFVFVLQKSGEYYTAKKTPIVIGELFQKGFEIREGLKAGDLVATAGLSSLLDGMTVRLLDQ